VGAVDAQVRRTPSRPTPVSATALRSPVEPLPHPAVRPSQATAGGYVRRPGLHFTKSTSRNSRARPVRRPAGRRDAPSLAPRTAGRRLSAARRCTDADS
jgi:hypothetical protein